MGHDNVEKKALGKANKLAIEAISNIRTVASLRKENYFVEEYNKELAGPHESSRSRSHLRGIVFGFAQSMPFFAYGGCMFYGGYLVYSERLPYKVVFTVAEVRPTIQACKGCMYLVRSGASTRYDDGWPGHSLCPQLRKSYDCCRKSFQLVG